MKGDPDKYLFKLTMGGRFSWYKVAFIHSERETVAVKILKKYYDNSDPRPIGTQISINPKNLYTIKELTQKKHQLFPMLFAGLGSR